MLFLRDRPHFVASTADGSKFFECSTQKGVFKRLAAGDLLILTQIKSGCAVVAVGVVAHAAVCQETRRSVLRRMLPRSLHGKLEEYVGQKKTFDYVQFERVFDARRLQLTSAELLAKGGYEPTNQPWVGLLTARATPSSSFERLSAFLERHAVVRECK